MADYGLSALTSTGIKTLNQDAKSFLFKAKITTGGLPNPVSANGSITAPYWANTGVPTTSEPPLVFTACHPYADGMRSPSILGIFPRDGFWKVACMGPNYHPTFQSPQSGVTATLYVFEKVANDTPMGHGISIFKANGELSYSTADDRKPLFIRHMQDTSFDARTQLWSSSSSLAPIPFMTLPDTSIVKPGILQPTPTYGYQSGLACPVSRTSCWANISLGYTFNYADGTPRIWLYITGKAWTASIFILPWIFWAQGTTILIDCADYD